MTIQSSPAGDQSSGFLTDVHRVLDALDTAVVIIGPTGDISAWNAGASDLFGWSRDEVIGKNVGDLLVPHELLNDVAEIHGALARGESWSGKLRLVRQDGSEVLLPVSQRPLVTEEGTLAGAVLTASLEGDLRRMEDQLRDSPLGEEEFVGIAAHELLSSLTSVSGFALRLRRAAETPDSPLGGYAQEIDWLGKGVDRLQHTVDLLLHAARLDRDGGDALPSEPIDLAAVTRAIVRSAARRTRGVSWQLRIPDEGLAAHGSEEAIHHVVRNLVDNAVKYAGDPPRIEVRVEALGDSAQVAVRDNGPGVPEHEREQIFARYFRGQAAMKQEGLGLGLFISRELARRQGGDIDLVRSSGVGAEFAFRLPRPPAA